MDGRKNTDLPVPGTLGGNFINESGLYYTTDPVLVVGSQQAVPAEVDVVVSNPARPGLEITTESADNGSFNVPLIANIGDLIEVEIVLTDIELDSVWLRLEPASEAANRANADLDAFYGDPTQGGGWPPSNEDGFIVTPPNADGLVTVSGPPGLLVVGITVVVANLSRGGAASTSVRADGGFAVELAAQSQDQLSVFAVEPSISNGGTTPISVYVP
jgi:hypothetical protein